MADSVLQVKSSPLLILVNKVLLEHRHAHSSVYHLWLLSYYNNSVCLGPLKYLDLGLLHKNATDPLFKEETDVKFSTIKKSLFVFLNE